MLLSFSSCTWNFDDPIRKVTCIQAGDYDYLEHDWVDSTICTTEVCSVYTAIWKELFISHNHMTEKYFEKHISLISSAYYSGDKGEEIHIGFRVQNDWAIAEGGDKFITKIHEDYDGYPEIGLPKGSYLTIDEIESAIVNGGFNSKIRRAPKTGPLRYGSMKEALDSLIQEARVDTLCFKRVLLSRQIGTLTMEASGIFEDEENACIRGTLDLITGQANIYESPCEKN